MRARVAVSIAVALLVSGCTNAVPGTAQPDPRRVTVAPRASTDPCSLLTSDEAVQLGLAAPGMPQPEDKTALVPPSCEWNSTDPESEQDNSLQVYYATDLNVREYFSDAPTAQEQLGGVTWDNYPSVLGASLCNLAVTLSDRSFIALTSPNFGDPTHSCDTARKAAPLVAKRIPG
ncbi:DUF3558 domain-containing protein [Amycolatopsis acidiphila]|uniref:DUF3558 domain-containing protein n=1 Tax=Amycolatopsis acidiphila TaxID=715473 RepID=A0A558AMP0_9PSEU|nr:DUF3558 family protein [Amycolatopsis acidiphila]TVT25529.1 DUF3558 domain-containing protein [Amycolatopsis acidiphila]UIJ60274.1 DUF3558 domain-containing protein [Amycolatopsis acidiphila]GHG60357.1 hypothetical protein GCM10017788_14040 [Amycolatopsis acidiphila]